jgi:hypothetical protein
MNAISAETYVKLKNVATGRNYYKGRVTWGGRGRYRITKLTFRRAREAEEYGARLAAEYNRRKAWALADAFRRAEEYKARLLAEFTRRRSWSLEEKKRCRHWAWRLKRKIERRVWLTRYEKNQVVLFFCGKVLQWARSYL